ncbi:VOC family protein [Rhodovibrionaceae bacterium A322]
MILDGMMPLLNVEDVQRSLDFYRNALGFEVEQKFEDEGQVIFAVLTHGDLRLMLNCPPDPGSDHRRQRPSYGETVFYFRVPDIHAGHAHLVEGGYAPSPVERQSYGVDEFTLRDPDGYELAFGAEVME